MCVCEFTFERPRTAGVTAAGQPLSMQPLSMQVCVLCSRQIANSNAYATVKEHKQSTKLGSVREGREHNDLGPREQAAVDARRVP